MINIVLYKPDIPQNTAAIVRLAACFNLKIHIIEPCGFNLNDSRFKRVAMDYIGLSHIVRYPNFETFMNKNSKFRIVLMILEQTDNPDEMIHKHFIVGEIECKKDTSEVLKKSLMKEHNEAMKAICKENRFLCNNQPEQWQD